MKNWDQLYSFLGLVLRLNRSCREPLNLRGLIVVILTIIEPILCHFILIDWNRWALKLLH
jgi:hypothetical protein